MVRLALEGEPRGGRAGRKRAIPTPGMPAMTGRAAADAERKTSSRMSRAARMRRFGALEVLTAGANAVPPACTSTAAPRSWPAASLTGLTSALLARVTVA